MQDESPLSHAAPDREICSESRTSDCRGKHFNVFYIETKMLLWYNIYRVVQRYQI